MARKTNAPSPVPQPEAPGFAAGTRTLAIRGADVSSLAKSEDCGGVYASADGRQADALQILADHGMNYARLRVWLAPADGYHDQAELLRMARRLKDRGMGLLVDLHYSDFWADPGKQFKPAAWEGLDFEHLEGALYDHTHSVCRALVDQGTPPGMVQIGNEINHGMLWPDGHTDRWDQLAALLKAGHRAVKAASPSTQVMLHLAEGGKNDLFRAWFGNAIARDVPFDLIGASYYPYWHGSLADLQANLDDLALRYGRSLVLAETAYPFSSERDMADPNLAGSQEVAGYPLSPDGQARMLGDILSILHRVPNGRGLGFFWWEATWTAVPGNGWDPRDPASGNGWANQALFDFESRALPALKLFGRP
jgi:arabinogalactan endo-1,4-beta-galactosidase